MTTPRRLSRGSHRLGIALAAIPLVAGLAFTAFLAHSLHGSDKKAEAAQSSATRWSLAPVTRSKTPPTSRVI